MHIGSNPPSQILVRSGRLFEKMWINPGTFLLQISVDVSAMPTPNCWTSDDGNGTVRQTAGDGRHIEFSFQAAKCTVVDIDRYDLFVLTTFAVRWAILCITIRNITAKYAA